MKRILLLYYPGHSVTLQLLPRPRCIQGKPYWRIVSSCVLYAPSLLSVVRSDLGSGKDLALLHCLGKTLVYNCPAHHDGPRRDRYANMNFFIHMQLTSGLVACIILCWGLSKADELLFPFIIISIFSTILVTNIVCTGMQHAIT